MRSSRRRRAALTLGIGGVICAIAVLSGCSTEGSAQRDLSARLENLDGVDEVRYDLDSSIFHLSTHRLTIVVSPVLGEEEAQLIAQESCEPDLEISTLTVTNSAGILDPRTVVSVQGPSRGSSCINEEALVGFARATAAMHDLGDTYDGDFNVYLGDPAGSDTDPDPDITLDVTTVSASRSRLVDALRALHDRHDGALDYSGKWASYEERYFPNRPTLTVHLSADEDLARLIPIIEHAHQLGVGSINIDDTAIVVQLLDDTQPGGDATLVALAQQAGIALTVDPVPAP